MKQLLVDDVGEFGLIRRIMHDFIFRPELLVVGPGDDGAVYRTPGGYDQVISTDTMVEGIHFTRDTMSPFDVGYHLRLPISAIWPPWGPRPWDLSFPLLFPEIFLFPGWTVFMTGSGPAAESTG